MLYDHIKLQYVSRFLFEVTRQYKPIISAEHGLLTTKSAVAVAGDHLACTVTNDTAWLESNLFEHFR